MTRWLPPRSQDQSLMVFHRGMRLCLLQAKLAHSLQLGCDLVDQSRFLGENFTHSFGSLFRDSPLTLLQGLPDRGDGLDGISGVGPRGVDLVFEPGPAGQ